MLHITKIKPLFNSIITTGDKYEEDEYDKGIITASKGDLKLYQTVLEVGTTVRDIKVGDKIMFNPQNYAVMKYDPNSVKNDMDMNKVIKWNLPWVTIYDENDKPHEYLMLNERDVMYVYEGEEKKGSVLKIEDNKLIL